jgi:hypothetical protein
MRKILKYRWALWSAILNLLGSCLLLAAFQATSTNFLLFTDPNSKEALICVGDPPHGLISTTEDGAFVMGVRNAEERCKSGKPSAIVNSDHPWMLKAGIVFMLIGFGLQIKSIDRTESHLTPSQIRALKNLGLFSN